VTNRKDLSNQMATQLEKIMAVELKMNINQDDLETTSFRIKNKR
tara:strand:- start:939 stop:1070 length:132 start_codon:yes stop_codon:yes gene_type:complete